MKRCPVCRRTYPDDAQNFCLDDGATLVTAAPPGPASYDNRQSPTDPVYQRPTAGIDRAYQPTINPYSAPFATPQKRSSLPWILGIVVVLVAGTIVTIILLSNRSGSTTTTNTTNTATSPTKADINSTTKTNTTTTTATGGEGWQTVNGDQFSFTAPGTSIKNEQTEPSPAGPIHTHLYTSQQGYEGFIAGYAEYPDLVFASGDNEKVFDIARDGAIQNVNGTVTKERSISLGSYPGREIIGNAPSQNISFTVRLYLAKPRLYMLMHTQYGLDQPLSADGTRFLDSFQINK